MITDAPSQDSQEVQSRTTDFGTQQGSQSPPNLGYKIAVARQLGNLAELHLHQENQQQAEAYLTEALAMSGIEQYRLVHQRLLALQAQCGQN